MHKMTEIPGFAISRLPRIVFGAGVLSRLPEILEGYGGSVLFVLGRRSFAEREVWATVQRELAARKIAFQSLVRNSGEPSPEEVDALVAEARDRGHKVVVGAGGGSTLDAAKAVAGLLQLSHSVMDFLEGVGPERPYTGPATPFIAVPTTAGTGSEATRNAVLSRSGAAGFKKSFRHEALTAEWAIVDPDLVAGCPPAILAGDGMDAFTQLLESYVSSRANPMTDALAHSGMAAAQEGLVRLFETRGEDATARQQMAYAALLSGICLAQTRLGVVHGLAGPLGAMFPIAHGTLCGMLVAEATRCNIEALAARAPNSPALRKYAAVARALTGKDEPAALVALLQDWSARLKLPRLADYGVTSGDFDRITAAAQVQSSMQTNPIRLQDDEVRAILAARL